MGFEIIPYSTEWDAAIRELCRIPVSGNISIALEREPNYFIGANIQTERPEVFLCIESIENRAVGVFNIGTREVYINGAPTRVGYWCDLRIHPDFHGSTVLFRILKFIANYELLQLDWPAQTIVFGDNFKMRDLIERSNRSKFQSQLPHYHPAGTYITTMLGLGKFYAVGNDYLVRQASEADIPLLQVFIEEHAKKKQYAAVVNLSKLGTSFYRDLKISDFWLAMKSNKLVGVCGTWDQSKFKQTRIHAYSKKLFLIRPVFNCISKIMKRPRLPPTGATISYLNLHTTWTEEQPQILEVLLKTIANHYRKGPFQYLMYGCFQQDPALNVLEIFKNKRHVIGHYFLISPHNALPTTLLGTQHSLELPRI